MEQIPRRQCRGAMGALPGLGMSLPGRGGDTVTGPVTVCGAEHGSNHAWPLHFHPENTGVNPATPCGRPGCRVAVPLGSRCRLFSASIPPPRGRLAPSPPGMEGWGLFCLPSSACRDRERERCGAAAAAPCPRCRRAACCFPLALPRAGPAAPGPLLRLLFPVLCSMWPRSRVLPWSVSLGVRVTHPAAGTPSSSTSQGRLPSLAVSFSPLST